MGVSLSEPHNYVKFEGFIIPGYIYIYIFIVCQSIHTKYYSKSTFTCIMSYYLELNMGLTDGQLQGLEVQWRIANNDSGIGENEKEPVVCFRDHWGKGRMPEHKIRYGVLHDMQCLSRHKNEDWPGYSTDPQVMLWKWFLYKPAAEGAATAWTFQLSSRSISLVTSKPWRT